MYTQRRKNTTRFSSRKFNLNLESPPKKSKNSSSSHKYTLFLLLFVVALMGVAVTQNGLTGYVVGVPEWENTTIITVNSSTEAVIVSITFGENKPEFCSDGIYIETQYNNEVEFSVENEVYENNTCTSCNVVFANIIYEENITEEITPPTPPPITTIPAPEEEPTPPEEEEEITPPPITTLPPEEEIPEEEEEPAEEEPPAEEQEEREPIPPLLTALIIAQNEITYYIYYGKLSEEEPNATSQELEHELPPLRTMAGECNGSANVNLTEAVVCDNLTIDPGIIYNTSMYDLTITNNLTVNGTFLGWNGSHSIGGSLTVNPTGVFNASNGTTTITGNTLINGTWNTPNNATINISNVTHNGTTNMGDWANWHLYGEWAGYGTLNGFSSPNRATITAYNNSKIMGTLDGNNLYIYAFIIPEGEIVGKYGSTFGVHTGKLEINGTFEYVTGYSLRLTNLGANIFIGPNANVSTIRAVNVGTNTFPESTWWSFDANSGTTIALSGNLTMTRDDSYSQISYYLNESKSTMNLNGYSLTATGSSHDLYIGSSAYSGDEGFAGIVNMDGGSITGFDNINVYTKNSTINDTGAGLIEATGLYLRYGNITLNETIVNITGNSYINSTFTGGSGSHYLNNLTIDLDGEYTGAGNLTFTGTAQITNGSLNNFTITNMNSTRAWFYNSTNIQLHPWTTLPAEGSVDLISRAINASNTSVNGNMSLRIYYSDADISGLTEANLQIFRYNGSDWVNISSSVNETENYVWAEGITEFSEFGVGEEIIVPRINIDWIYPTSNINATQYEFFNVSVNVTCLAGTCGEINTSLDPWFSGWNYRKSHEIAFASGAGTNYQVKIIVVNGTGSDSGNVVYINKSQNDFDDIRFTDDDGTTLLDYWIENYTIGENATFWVEVADDLSSSNATIYIYYGSSGASTTSNGSATSLFFDDFTGGTEVNATFFVNFTRVANNPLKDVDSQVWINGLYNDYDDTIHLFYMVGGGNRGIKSFSFNRTDANNTAVWTDNGEIFWGTHGWDDDRTEPHGAIFETQAMADAREGVGAGLGTPSWRLYYCACPVANWTQGSIGFIYADESNLTNWTYYSGNPVYENTSNQGYADPKAVVYNDEVWITYGYYPTSAIPSYWMHSPNGTDGWTHVQTRDWSSSGGVDSVIGTPIAFDEGILVHGQYGKNSTAFFTTDGNDLMEYSGNPFFEGANDITKWDDDIAWYVTILNKNGSMNLNGSGTYYMYYAGNNDTPANFQIGLATSTSQVQETFHELNTNKWNLTSDENPIISNNIISIDDFGIKTHSTYGMNNTLRYQGTIYSPVEGGNYDDWGISGWDNDFDISTPYEVFIQRQNYNVLHVLSDGAYSASLGTGDLDATRIFEIQRNSTAHKFLINDSLKITQNSPSTATMPSVFYSFADKEKVDLDWVQVNKFVEPTPTHGVWGAEEEGKVGLISTTIGATPFYTNVSNPNSTSFNENDSYTITWWVNATGTVNGIYEFFAFANQTSNMSNSNITSKLNVTIVALVDYPVFSNYYVNESLISNGSYARFNLTVNDTSDSISYVNGTINSTHRIFSNTSLTHWYYDYLCNSSGTITWTHISANDSSNNWNNTAVSNINFTCDADFPQFSGQAVNNTSIIENNYFCINVTITDGTSAINTAYAEINNTTTLVNYTLSNSTSIANCGGGGNTWSAQIQATANGTWNYSAVWANDTANNANSTDFEDIEINVSNVPDYPQFFDFHVNETLISNGSYARFNLTVNDTSDSISYVNGTINSTHRIFSNTSLTHWYYDYLCNSSGTITWTHISANDSSDNWNNTAVSNINFTCDADIPQFSNSAINESTIATNEYFCVNITITDGTSAINTAYAEINNTTTLVNYTLSNSTSIANCGGGGNTWSAQIQATANGTWNYSKVWANDSVNNANSTDFEDINITVVAPKINIDWIYPTSNINATQYEFFNVTVNVTCLAGNCGEINTSLDPTIYTTSDSSLTAIGAHHLERLSDGTLVAAFTDVNGYGMIGNSTDNGTTWNTETVINADVVGSYQGVSMVVDSNDVIWYFFINQSDKDLYYVNGTFGSWSSPVNITSSTINGPDTAIDSNDIIHVTYSDMGPTPDENKYVTSSNWSNPYTLHTSGDDRQYPHIDIDSNDIPHIILATYADGDLMYYNKTGGSWSSATVINDAAYDMRRGNIEIDDQDRVHAVYSQDIGSNYYIVGHKYKNESSGWSSATTIADKGSIYDQITPTCRLDNSNRLWIFWAGDGWELHHAQKQICYKYLNLTDWTWDSPGSSNATCITNYQEAHATPVLMESYQIHDGMAVAYIWQDYSGGDDYLFFNTTSGIQWDSPIKSGLIPFGSGTPFYTNRSNPNSTSFNENDSYTITWWVNATGEADTTHEFYVYANRTADMSQNNITSKLNVTITANVAPTITNAAINDSSAVAQYTIVKVNASVTDVNYDLDNVTLEITPPISPAYNTTPSNDTPSHFYNDTINLTEKGRWLFGFRANDTQGNNATLVLAQDLNSNYFIDVEPEANITIVYPYSNESIPIDTSSVEINITTDYNADCEWNDTDINFAYGTGTAFTNGQGATQHSFTKSGLINGENYAYYYKCNTTSFGNINSQSTVHNFSVYNDSLKITSNSVRLYASGNGVLDTYVGFRYIFDSRLNTNFTTYDNSIWNDTTTFYLNFILPDRSGTPYEGIRNFSVSYFRYRCPALDGCPDKFDVYVDNTLILVNKTVTPTANTWINIDVPDTNFTANSGSFIWVIKSVNGTGSQRIVISDIEIFSTEFTEYTSQSTQTGFVEIPMWWNNLQWAHTFRIDDVCNVTWTVNNTEAQLSPLKQPLTLMVWGNDTSPLCDDGVGYPGPDYGNSTEITNKGHEYGSHSCDDAGGSPYAAGYSYFQAVTWANESRKDIEDNVYNTSRWSNNTILTFGYPGSKVNYHGTEALYDAGFRVADSINSAGLETNANGYASIHTSWQGYAGGINTTRDEKDWLQFIRIGMAEGALASDFEENWNWTRDNGLLGDMIKHCYGLVHCTTISQGYLNVLGNDTVGWHATQGEVRSYYYYYQHMNLTYNSSASTGTSKIYDVHVHYENNQDRGRIWRVPVTFGFNITEIGFTQSSVITYLENDLGLVNISGNQTMAEGYKFNTTEYTGTTMLYLSVKKDDGDQINITGALAPKINLDWIYPTDNLSMPKYEFFNVSVNVTCLKNTCGAINTTIAHNESDINITAGATPFYTNMSNPNSTSFNENDSYVITWWVNTTGTPGTVWPFFVYANRTADMSQNNITTPSYYVTIQQPKAIAIDLSATLTSGIRWNITNLSIAQHSALGNNQSGTDNQTAYNITIIAQSCTADLYVNATGDLASGVDTIGLPNETYSYNLTDRYVPSDNKTSLNTSYQLITSGISSQTVHFKFYLNVTSGQAAGTYRNNLTFKVVELGASP